MNKLEKYIIRGFSICFILLTLGFVKGFVFPTDPYRNWKEETIKGTPLYVGLESYTTGGDFFSSIRTHHKLTTRIQTEKGEIIGHRGGVPFHLLDEAKELIESERTDGDSELIKIIGYDQNIGFRINSVISAQGDRIDFGKEGYFYKKIKDLHKFFSRR